MISCLSCNLCTNVPKYKVYIRCLYLCTSFKCQMEDHMVSEIVKQGSNEKCKCWISALFVFESRTHAPVSH